MRSMNKEEFKKHSEYLKRTSKPLSDDAVLDEVRRHGEGFCEKVVHNGDGYHHSKDDDTAYFVDGVGYCGRCHHYLDKFSD